MPNIQLDIGMEAHKSPSVFNFYQPEYTPAGPVARASLVAPEAGGEPLAAAEWAKLATDLKRLKWLDDSVLALAAACPALGLQVRRPKYGSVSLLI